MFAQNYKQPSVESSRGNVSADPMDYTFSGTEASGTTIRLRKMHDKNTYMRIRAIADTGIVSTVNVGYVSRDADEADDLTAFATGIDLSTANQIVSEVLTEIAFDHDIAITTSVAATAGNADKSVTFLTEFINVSG